MQIAINFTASGAHADVVNQVGQEIRQLRREAPDAGAVLYAIRDHAVNAIAGAHETAPVSVSISATIEIKTTVETPEAPAAPEARAAVAEESPVESQDASQ